MDKLTFRNNLGVATSNINPRENYMDFVNRLAEYEDIGTVEEYASLAEFAKLIKPIMELTERVNCLKIKKGEREQPLITWQLYNALVKISKSEITLSDAEKLMFEVNNNGQS
jgi:hypothetical protein